jgi:hypothetical protein
VLVSDDSGVRSASGITEVAVQSIISISSRIGYALKSDRRVPSWQTGVSKLSRSPV